MEWPTTLELTVDGIAQGGEGVGRWEGRVVFVRGVLPGERVVVRLTERRDAYARGEAMEILEPSAARVVPRMPEADHMPWQHISYDEQLAYKRQILAEQLAKIGGLTDVQVEATFAASSPWGYRNNARFHVEQGRVGYYAAGSRHIQPIEADPLLLPVLNDVLAGLRATLRGSNERFEVTLRASEAYGYVVAAMRGSGSSLHALARRWVAQTPALSGVVLPSGVVGSDHLIEELGGIAFHLRPETFFQVNVASASALLREARAGLELKGQERLIDLYCGAGAFTLPLARSVAEVVGVEEYAGAVADAEATATANEISNTRFLVGPVERVLSTLNEQFDGVLMDPPRRGAHPQALAELIRLAPPRIVYVSCHPGTLARDLKILTEGGYQIKRVQAVDLFPQTPHVESVTVLVHSSAAIDN